MALDATLQSVGDYDLVEKLAEGGMGTVYKGRHRPTGQIVAIKVVPPTMLNNQVLLKRFENEFRAASKLNHPNVVRALEYGTVTGRPFLVMEFVEGESLGQRIERDGKLAEEDAIRIISLAAQGLDQAHNQGMIHRDIKPDNIMVTPDGQVKVADMGLVKEMEADMNLTRTGRGLGTPHFMAPEQFRNAKNADIRCDVYSLGATLYMTVTGKLPFEGCGPLDAWMKKVHNELAPARKVVPALSERIDAAIQRSMNPDPKLRQGNCQEFVAELTGKAVAKNAEASKDGTQEIFYLVYKDDDGVTHTVKGSVEGIRRSLKEGLLGDASNIRACRTKTGTFQPLDNLAQFRDLVPAPSTMTRPPGPPTPTHLPPLPTGSGIQIHSQAPSDADKRLHIPFGASSEQLPEGIKMLLVAVVAMSAGMLIFYLMKR